MRVANRLILDRAQTKALGRVVRGLLEATVVEQQHLGLPVLKEEFAVVGPVETARDDFGDFRLVEAGAVEQRSGGVHDGSPEWIRAKYRRATAGSQGWDVRNRTGV